MVTNKILGFIFLLLGVLITFKGPDISDYQPGKFTASIIALGLAFIALGIYFLKL